MTSFAVEAQAASGNSPESQTTRRHWDHFSYLVELKNDIAQAYWPDFAKEDLPSPVVYYTLEGTFVINPNPHILELTNPEPNVSPNPDWEVYRLPEAYTDTLNFQFANSFSDDPKDLYYGENVMIFSSFELTRRFIPDLTDLQDWAIMVHHELFHAYQRSRPEYKAFFQNLSIPGGPDAYLGSLHREWPWFQDLVYRENEILKALWQGQKPVNQGILEYLAMQKVRRGRVLEAYGIAIGEVEDYEILMEGHARYFESLAKRYIRDHSTDTSMLSEADRGRIGNLFAGYDPAKDNGLSDIYNDRYYYPQGYNISMILEKYLPGYAETIYQSEFNFNTYLYQMLGESLQEAGN